MKKFKYVFTGIALLIAALFLMLTGCTAEHVPSTETDNAFTITAFDLTMHVKENREIETVERITVQFNIPRSGIVRDFDLTGGVRYKSLSATRDGGALPMHAQNDVGDMLSWYLGDENITLSTGREYVYELRYTLIVPALAEKGYLPLDVLGYDWYTNVQQFTATITLPAGLSDYKVYSGYAGASGNNMSVVAEKKGNVVHLAANGLPAHCGITLDMQFSAGVLTEPPADYTPLWAVLAVAVLLAVFAAFKLLICTQPILTRTVNFTAPDEMDPLKMGKLIDNKVDPEDIGALVFWLAAKEYLIIDLSEDKDDPILIRTGKPLEGDVPAHVRTFYGGLFKRGDRVQVSDLKNTFYTTADAVKASVNSTAGPMYAGKGYALAIALGFLTAVIFGGLALICSVAAVGGFYSYWLPLVLTAIGYIISFSLSYTAQMHTHKWGRGKRIFCRIGGFLLGCLPALGAWMILSPAFSPIAVVLLVVGSAVLGMGGGFLLVRTEEYNEKLGHILGFRDFILFTERDKISFMLEENPELYYEILPYAQVLGVSNEWTNKFEGLALSAPSYVRYNSGDILFSALVWNSMFRSMNSGMARTFVSRPSNSGGGGHSGGFGGGFGGGGFGGGGGRSF